MSCRLVMLPRKVCLCCVVRSPSRDASRVCAVSQVFSLVRLALGFGLWALGGLFSLGRWSLLVGRRRFGDDGTGGRRRGDSERDTRGTGKGTRGKGTEERGESLLVDFLFFRLSLSLSLSFPRSPRVDSPSSPRPCLRLALALALLFWPHFLAVSRWSPHRLGLSS